MEILRESPEAASWSRDSFLEAVRDPGSLALVFESDRLVTGFLIGRLVQEQAEILNLAVAPNRRHQGVATRLLEAALAKFRLQATETAYLEVRESNAVGIAFYFRHGFSPVGRRKDYYQGPTEAAVTMAKKLFS